MNSVQEFFDGFSKRRCSTTAISRTISEYGFIIAVSNLPSVSSPSSRFCRVYLDPLNVLRDEERFTTKNDALAVVHLGTS